MANLTHKPFTKFLEDTTNDNSQLVLISCSTVRLDSAISSFVVAHCLATLGGRASLANFTAAATAALSTSFALDQKDLASFTTRHCDIGFCRSTPIFATIISFSFPASTSVVPEVFSSSLFQIGFRGCNFLFDLFFEFLISFSNVDPSLCPSL